jgi:Ca2+-binding EF-hand superfamily protein
MLRWLLAFAVTVVIGLGAAQAQDSKKPPKKPHKTVEEIFKAKDTNQDGKLSKEEYMKDVPEARKAAMEKRFTAMDTDKDGFVTPEEMKAAFEKMKERREKNGKGGK